MTNTISSDNTQKPIAIIGAMEQEVSILKNALTNPQVEEVANITFYTGKLNGIPVVISQSGIGKVNASISTALVIERFSPKSVINTGSAGGIGDALAVGDVVIGRAVSHHDVDVTAFGYEIGQMAQMPAFYTCDETLVSVIESASTTFDKASVHKGLIVSGDQFISDSNTFAVIKNNFPQALAVEMEAAAIAQTCFRFDVPFVVVRAISDLANEEASISFDEFIVQAGKSSAEMVIAALQHM